MNERFKRTVVASGTYHGYDYLAIEYMASILQWHCGYVKLPEDHPYAPLTRKVSWFDLGLNIWKYKKTGSKPKPSRHYVHNGYDSMDVIAHGGLTYSVWWKKKDEIFTPGPWIGWDYNHPGDAMYIDRIEDVPDKVKPVWEKIMNVRKSTLFPEKRWTALEIETECKDVICQLEDI